MCKEINCGFCFQWLTNISSNLLHQFQPYSRPHQDTCLMRPGIRLKLLQQIKRNMYKSNSLKTKSTVNLLTHNQIVNISLFLNKIYVKSWAFRKILSIKRKNINQQKLYFLKDKPRKKLQFLVVFNIKSIHIYKYNI